MAPGLMGSLSLEESPCELVLGHLICHNKNTRDRGLLNIKHLFSLVRGREIPDQGISRFGGPHGGSQAAVPKLAAHRYPRELQTAAVPGPLPEDRLGGLAGPWTTSKPRGQRKRAAGLRGGFLPGHSLLSPHVSV